MPNKKHQIHQQKEQVGEMFNGIAGKYDFLNHFLSLGTDHIWRKQLIRKIDRTNELNILDVATGTGDLAIAAAKNIQGKIYGIDISEGMLNEGQKKIDKKQLSDRIHLQQAGAEQIPFENESFDVVMVAFGIRNFRNLNEGLSEMGRVLKKDGVILILEFSIPENPVVRSLYMFYFKNVLPLLGRMISGHRFAYSYLPESVRAFPQGEKLGEIMRKSGIYLSEYQLLSLGVVTLYTGRKGGAFIKK